MTSNRNRNLFSENIILVDGVPKVSDLGGSKELVNPKMNSPYVVSRVYRAPELILGLEYEINIDVWSLGVMIFEGATYRTPFNGKTEGLQLLDIYEQLGSPTDEEFKALKKRCSYDSSLWNKLRGIPKNPNFWNPLQEADSSGQLKDLLLKCFQYLPENRISSQGILDHPFFAESNESPK